MPEFVRYTLEDGAEVVVESAESDLVQRRGGGDPDVVDGCALARLAGVAAAAIDCVRQMASIPSAA